MSSVVDDGRYILTTIDAGKISLKEDDTFIFGLEFLFLPDEAIKELMKAIREKP